MELWKISQKVNTGVDVYDSAIVVAESPDRARETLPWDKEHWNNDDNTFYVKRQWARPRSVLVERIGVAHWRLKAGLVLASFNAG